ncbi:unnamed protein product, partial [Discosporangium mesarthrocarpum]
RTVSRNDAVEDDFTAERSNRPLYRNTVPRIDPRFIKPKQSLFDGDREKFPTWANDTLNVAGFYDCAWVLESTVDIPIVRKRDADLINLGYSTNEVVQIRNAWMLLLSGQKVDSIRNTLTSIGVVNKAWSYLGERYTPKSSAEKMTLLSKYESIRLKVGQDPMELKAEQDNIRDLLRSQGLLVEETMANTSFLRSLG